MSYTRRRAVQPTCGAYKCEEAFALRKAKKRIAREAYLADLEQRSKAGVLKPIGELKALATQAFHSYIRLRDFFDPCISCGDPNPPRKTFGGAWDAGHYLSRGAHPELRFEPLNCHKQCKRCNGTDARGPTSLRTEEVRAKYRVSLERKIGPEKLAWLEGSHEPKRYRAEDYVAEKLKWQAAARALRAERKAATNG